MSNNKTTTENTTEQNRVEESKLWGVFWLRKGNFSYGQISKLVNMKRASVQTIVRRIAETGSPLRGKAPGSTPKLDERTLRHLKNTIRENPFSSYFDLKMELERMDIHVHRDTVISACRSLEFYSFDAAKKPKLTQKHKDARLRWAKEKVGWSVDQWKNVIWSDESRFCLGCQGHSRKVIRKFKERYEERNTIPTVKFGCGSVMVWGCFWGGGFGPLKVIDVGTVNQDEYVNILAKTLLSWLVEVADREEREMVLQEDGATCHTGAYAQWWKQGHQIRGFEYWPAQSPDLNPIEHIWDALGRLVEKRRPQMKTLKDLEAVLQEEWSKLDVEYAERLVASMTRRCQAVIEARGGTTKY